MAHPQQRSRSLRLFDATQRYSDRPSTPGSAGATVEQLMREDDASSRWSPHGPPSGFDHELNDDHTASNTKRSVLAKVREKAKKWRQTLIKRKHSEDGNTVPSWGVSLDEEEEVEEEGEGDPEYLGAPMYESEKAPELYRETARQHPRANPVIPENHLLPTSSNSAVEPEKGSLKTLTQKLGPAYATVSDATLAIASKLHSLTVSNPEPSPPAPSYQELHVTPSQSPAARDTSLLSPVARGTASQSPMARGTASPSHMARGTASLSSAARGTTSLNPAARGTASLSPATRDISSASPAARGTSTLSQPKPVRVTEKNVGMASSVVDNKSAAPSTVAPATVDNNSGMSQKWDKGVSVKEYIMNKFEPGEDEKALSQAISQAISPRKNSGNPGVVDIVKDAVNSFLRKEEAHQPSIYHSAESSSAHIIDAREVEEETQTHGRILQAN